MSTTSELIERLRTLWREAERRSSTYKLTGMSFEAQKEVENFRAIHEAADRLDELERENARLREALKPFADPSSFLGNVTDDDVQNARDVLGIVTKRRIGSSAALAGSGEK